MRLFFSFSLLLIVNFQLLILTSCRQEMAQQPRYREQDPSPFFADGQAARHLVPGTVPYGEMPGIPDVIAPAHDPGTFPEQISLALLKRGQERFNIFCSPCHSRTGDGDGMIVRRGYRRPPSFHEARLRTAPHSHFFDVITNGSGAMPSYGVFVPVSDRWAIIAYIRALQLSQHTKVASLTEEERARLAQQ
jgi:hypothetical protein